MDTSTQNRRTFIGKTTAMGAALGTLGTSSAIAAEKSKNHGDYFRVGCLNVHSYSHLIGLWGPLINPRKGQKDTPFTGMRITHCWDIEQDKAKEFAGLYGCETVKNFDDMLGKVDGIISGGYYNHRGIISYTSPIYKPDCPISSTGLMPIHFPKPGK